MRARFPRCRLSNFRRKSANTKSVARRRADSLYRLLPARQQEAAASSHFCWTYHWQRDGRYHAAAAFNWRGCCAAAGGTCSCHLAGCCLLPRYAIGSSNGGPKIIRHDVVRRVVVVELRKLICRGIYLFYVHRLHISPAYCSPTPSSILLLHRIINEPESSLVRSAAQQPNDLVRVNAQCSLFGNCPANPSR